MNIFELLLFAILVPIVALFAVTGRALFVMPLIGGLVRFRANYTPIGLALDEEAFVGPSVTSLWAMLKRVKELEGIAGLYKGVIPYILTNTITFSLLIFALGAGSSFLPEGAHTPNPGGIRMSIVVLITTVIALPATCIVNRAITTPYRLGSRFQDSPQSLKLLLTPHERSKPWVLFLTPGLLPAVLIYTFATILGMRIFRNMLLPGWGDASDIALSGGDFPEDDPMANLSTFRFVFFFFVQAIATPFLCPLEVIQARLSLQRNNSLEQPSDESGAGAELIAEGEDVVGFRDEGEPYLGLVDCAQKMLQEEGVRALMRGWWITLSSNLLAGIP